MGAPPIATAGRRGSPGSANQPEAPVLAPGSKRIGLVTLRRESSCNGGRAGSWIGSHSPSVDLEYRAFAARAA